MARSDTERKLQQFARQNWAPARYGHLHPELKALIRELRFRPGIKRCYANCQYILLEAQYTALEPRIAYHEGLVRCFGVPLNHAWLTLDGVVQDPTLDKTGVTDYLASNVYSADRVRESALKTRHWKPIDEHALLTLLIAHCNR